MNKNEKIAQEIIDHFFDRGAEVSVRDYEWVLLRLGMSGESSKFIVFFIIGLLIGAWFVKVCL